MASTGQLTWGFYGRAREQAEVEKIISSGRWFFCAVSGRRRIGKTTLIQRALQARSGVKAFYFQVPDSDERGVVQTFQDAMEDRGFDLPQVQTVFRDFKAMAMAIGAMCNSGWIVVIDEFQYFHRKALAPFASFLQTEVDRLRDTNRGGLFVLGSIHTEMMAVLEGHQSPLFNRVTHRIQVGHWDFATLFEMFGIHGIVDPRQRLFLWSLFEGVPKFYRDCFEQSVLEPQDDPWTATLRRLFFEGSSPLRDEAANWFLRELRGRYDSVLKLLAKKGPCSYGELVAEYGRAGSGGEKQLTAYLEALVDRYQMVERRRPVFARGNSRKSRYVISDNFLAAWLSALSRNVQFARIQPVETAVAKAKESLQVHEGHSFEKMIRQLLEECSRKAVGDFPVTALVDGYWNKQDDSDIEIDIVAYDERRRAVRFGSCKGGAERHTSESLSRFEGHIGRFLKTKEGRRFSGWNAERALYSPVFSDGQRSELVRRGLICRDLRDFANDLAPREPSMFSRPL